MLIQGSATAWILWCPFWLHNVSWWIYKGLISFHLMVVFVGFLFHCPVSEVSLCASLPLLYHHFLQCWKYLCWVTANISQLDHILCMANAYCGRIINFLLERIHYSPALACRVLCVYASEATAKYLFSLSIITWRLEEQLLPVLELSWHDKMLRGVIWTVSVRGNCK